MLTSVLKMFRINNGVRLCNGDIFIVHELSSNGEFHIHIAQYERDVLHLDWLDLLNYLFIFG